MEICMNVRQQIFCEEYVKGASATQAYINAVNQR